MFKQCLLAMALALPLAATAAYPEKPVKIIVSNPPGGPVDVMLRVLASKLGAAKVLLIRRARWVGGPAFGAMRTAARCVADA